MNVLSAFISVSGWTLASRVLGLVRDIIVAFIFGAGALMDAFFAAFRLPNTLRRFTAEGALTQAFVPAYQKAKETNPEEAAAFAGELLCLLALSLAVLSALVIIAAPQVIAIVAPGLEQAEAAADMLRIVFPYILLISIVALFSGILNADYRFRAAAAAPIFLNIAVIVAALWRPSSLMPQETALAWGVMVGGILQLALTGFCVRRAGLSPRLRLRYPGARIKTALYKMGQSALGAGAIQINLLINLAIASLLPAGAISWLYYADRLMELPAGLLGAALSTVVLPAMSVGGTRAHTVLDNALRLAMVLSLPAACGMVILAFPIVSVLFLRGAFDWHDAQMTAHAVSAYGVGILGLVALRPLAAAFFARGDAATPAKVAVIALLMTQVFNGIFVFLLEWNHAGIALSIGLAATLNAVILLWLLRRRSWYEPLKGWGRLLACMLGGVAFMGVFLWAGQPAEEFWREQSLLARITALFGLGIVGSGVYFGVLWAGGVRFSDFRTGDLKSPD